MTLAKSGGVCETTSCLIGIQAGRVKDGAVVRVADLTCTGGGTAWTPTPWTLNATCAATNQARPEITHIRAIVYSSNGTNITSDWQPVSMPYPDPQVSVDAVQDTLSTIAATRTFTATVSSVTLAGADALCENRSCLIGAETGQVTGSSIATVGGMICTGADASWRSQPWTLHAECTSTASINTPISRIRAVVYADNGVQLVSPWGIVTAHASGVPHLSMNVTQWDNKHADAGPHSGRVDYQISAQASNLTGVGGPCELVICSLVFEGGLPDADGIIRVSSRIPGDGGSLTTPGIAQANISSGGQNVGIMDQLYLRAALYTNGHLVLSTDWQARSSLPIDTGNPAAALIAPVALAASRDLMRGQCLVFHEIPSSNLNGTTVNDLIVACEAGVLAGASPTRIYAAMANTFGAAAIIAAAEILLPTDYQPKPPTTAPDETSEFQDVLLSWISRTRIQAFGEFLPTVDATGEMSTAVDQCLIIATVDQCKTMPIFLPGSDVYEAAQHDA